MIEDSAQRVLYSSIIDTRSFFFFSIVFFQNCEMKKKIMEIVSRRIDEEMVSYRLYV